MDMRVGRREEMEIREQRRRARPEIGEDRACGLAACIGGVTDFVLIGAVARLGRLLETTAAMTHQPAVIEAA